MLALTLALLLQQADPEFVKFREESLRREKEGTYKKIEWQKSVGDALKKAKEEVKPLLVFLIVGHLAQKGAAEC